MFIVGLTGGIGSGKSTVSALFKKLGAPVIDADQIARELVEPGKPALKQITDTFGIGVLNPAKELDRNKMRQIIFQNPEKKETLESILHPLIRKSMQHGISQLKTPYCILEIPLLLETRQTDLVDRVLVIDVLPNIQYKRVQARSGLSKKEIDAIIATQIDRSSRIKAADDIIVNDKSRAELNNKVQQLHQMYLSLAEKE